MSVLDLATRYFDAWNARDADAVAATFAPGGTYHDPTLPEPLNAAALKGYCAGLWETFPDLSFELLGVKLSGGDAVAAEWVMRGTNSGSFARRPPTGRSVTLPGADFITATAQGIASVRGYFDTGAVPRQLGLQVVVQPPAVGPFSFGTAVRVTSGRKQRPGAFSVTAILARGPEALETVRNHSRATAAELLDMSGFIGWEGTTVGQWMATLTAWDDPDAPRQLISGGAHGRAMKAFFEDGIVQAGYTSVWVPHRVNAYWVRCGSCGTMADFAATRCTCGAALPEPPGYW